MAKKPPRKNPRNSGNPEKRNGPSKGGTGSRRPKRPVVRSARRGFSRATIIVVAVTLIVVAGLGAVVGLQISSSGKLKAPYSGPEPTVLTPAGTSGKGVTIGASTAKVNVDFYLDFRCPHCNEFENSTSGDELDSLVNSGQIKLTYHPLTFIDSGSEPAANAWAAAVAENKTWAFSKALWANYGQVWTTKQMIDLGQRVGLTDQRYVDAVNTDAYKSWLTSVSTAADQAGVSGTPTVLIAGQPLQDQSQVGIQQAVEAAALGVGGSATPTPTPASAPASSPTSSFSAVPGVKKT